MAELITATEHQCTEWAYTSTVSYANPFGDVELDVTLTHEDGTSIRVPAFWSGENEWRVRFVPRKPGSYVIETACSDADNQSLHGIENSMTVQASQDSATRIPEAPGIADGHFLDGNGNPMLWLGDTWWMALARRFRWPEDFKTLAADRVEKGYNVIQIVAGLHPDMPVFDKRCENEAGQPWLADLNRVNPGFFDKADERIACLVESGLVPCIVSGWGYYLPILGVDNIKRYWRYIIARWGVYPVVYCLAGEAAMPYYLSDDKPRDRELQIQGWTEVARYVRKTDPYGCLITIHPTDVGRRQVQDPALLDFDMLQTGHGGDTIFNLMRLIEEGEELEPSMPVVVGEANYEGILHDSGPEHQRRQFWISMLSGAAGYTYGANGIFQFNTKAEQFGPSPHGANWGDATWDEARQYAGSSQVGLGARYLATFDWHRMEHRSAWVTQPDGDEAKPSVPLIAAGVAGEFRLIYIYEPIFPWRDDRPKVLELEDGVAYTAAFWDPRTGAEHDIGDVTPDGAGTWVIPYPPTMSDWLLVLRNSS